jgi:hypothetical protein
VNRRYVVEFLDNAAFESVERLPQPHRDIAWELLDHLQQFPRYGKPLESNVATGDLSDARTMYVIDFAEQMVDWPPPYRIVYRLLPSERDVQRVQVIWTGERDNLEVYRTAARRLGR